MNIKSKIPEVQKVLDEVEKDHIGESSAQCAYYIMLSFVPFVILFLTIIQYTVIDAEQLFNIISEILPENMSEFVLGIVMEIYSKSIGTISISLVFTLFAASRGLYALIKGLHLIYNYSDNRKRSVIYLKLMSFVKTIIFVILMMITIVVFVFGRKIVSTMQDNFGMLENYTIISEILARLGFVAVGFVVLLLIYKFIPGHKITFKSQVWGALFSSVALNIVSIAISYVNVFNYSITYGSLTALFTVMIWAYFIFYIIFLGAEINKILGLRKKEKAAQN